MKKNEVLNEILKLEAEKTVIENKLLQLRKVYESLLNLSEEDLRLVVGVCFDNSDKVYHYLWECDSKIEVGDIVHVERYHKNISVTVVEVKIMDVSNLDYELKYAHPIPYDEIDLPKLLKNSSFVRVDNNYKLTAIDKENKDYGYVFSYDLLNNVFSFEKIYDYKDSYQLVPCNFSDETKKIIKNYMISQIWSTTEEKIKISVCKKNKG